MVRRAALVLDAGALIALDGNHRTTWALLLVAAKREALVRVPAGVVGQAWRDGARQALLARALRHCDEVPLDGRQARAAGVLCRRAGTYDVIDATVALACPATTDTRVLTSDPEDIKHLLQVLGTETVKVVGVSM